MWISSLNITNVRCFSFTHTFTFSKGINVFVGKNSSGKSTALRCLGLIQTGEGTSALARKGTGSSSCLISLENIDARLNPIHQGFVTGQTNPQIRCIIGTNNSRSFQGNRRIDSSQIVFPGGIPAVEPSNLFYTFFSKRKTQGFTETVNSSTTFAVGDTLINLYAKIFRLSNPENDLNSEFVKACLDILGHKVSAFQSANGAEAGLWIDQTTTIPLSDMGEGTSNILGLIVNLCVAQKCIFLIEELENDIHPEALKALLELISRKSADNQIFISTHSNIVLRHLGALPEAKVFSFVSAFQGRMPTTTVNEIESTTPARHEVLRALGYEPFDFGLWQAYLILEESSAEAVINRILIPSFIPSLAGKLRTISAGGATNVEPTYADFHRLFVFTHTSKIYHETAWVRADSDEAGTKVIATLSRKFPVAQARFSTYKQPAFENYYPARFGEEVTRVLAISAKDARRLAKETLCKQVLEWATNNPVEAKTEFQESAAEIIADLNQIKAAL